MNNVASLAAIVSVAALVSASQAFAADTTAYKPLGKGTLLIDLRVSDVVPSANSPIFDALGADTGLKVRVGDSIMPTLGIDYFLTDEISVEAILGVTEHSATAGAPGGAFGKVHSTWVLPPVVTVKYHPFPKAKISPYVGAGVNLMLYFAGHDFPGYTVKLKDEFGYAFQAGFDIPLTGPWTLNADAKKVFTSTRATINGGALTSNIALDPWVVSVGIGRRF
jgi:outer membrane protein